ncbi:DNA-directed RNA polymerase subunit omega [Carboxydochorda subterranea]|uniref:DNA-directed RNA polymerase subunit omega n=1 Tax=Carboxydichorda subterranea TaxID=3109565 RepID=A0ABZ1C0W8_9FIRM|nr:DNA-directed RNA polymerase subunit omega [Limnochorda sp. L945t]WRP18396.1 DNA-directed RNA polymerase subunit omega [Limnochorda sp. L945t]
MLNQPSLQTMLERNPARSRYILVTAAARRARQLLEGSPPLVAIDSTKPVTIALREIAEGRVICEFPAKGGVK